MSREEPEPSQDLSPEEQAFVEHLSSSYSPAPASAGQRTAFRARLDDRLERRSRARLLAPLLVAAAGAAALALWLDLPGTGWPGATDPGERTSIAQTGESVEDTLLALTTTTEPIDRDASLPDDYEAIASLLLDGV